MRRPTSSPATGNSLSGFSLERFATSSRADFRFAPLNVLLLVAFMVTGLIVHLSMYPFSMYAVVLSVGSALAISIMLRLAQVWEAAVVLATANCLALYVELRPESEILIVSTILALLVAPSIQLAYQWERSVLLRFGKFRGLKKPGLFVLIPVIDKVAQFVDQRIRVTDFSAETTLTSDTVPVNVDAIAFWMVWDAQKAVLEVEQFRDAVALFGMRWPYPLRQRCVMPLVRTT
jgi:hypothetical protein